MAGGTIKGKGLESIAIAQAPGNDCLYSIDTKSLGIVLQDHRVRSLRNTLGYVLKHFLRSFRTAGIFTVHIPVKVLKSFCFQFLGKAGHNTLIIGAADRIGAATRESAQDSFLTGMLIDHILHRIEIVEKRLIACINFIVIMSIGVDCD